jgi:hypothetical protein
MDLQTLALLRAVGKFAYLFFAAFAIAMMVGLL